MAALPVSAETFFWPRLRGQIDSVRAYTYDFTMSEYKERTILVEGNQLHPGIAEQQELTREQITRLIKALNAREFNQAAECFLPHHAFIFLDPKGRVIGHVSVCFLCGTGVASPGGPKAQRWDMQEMRRILVELGLPVSNNAKDYREYFDDMLGKPERRPRAKGGK